MTKVDAVSALTVTYLLALNVTFLFSDKHRTPEHVSSNLFPCRTSNRPAQHLNMFSFCQGVQQYLSHGCRVILLLVFCLTERIAASLSTRHSDNKVTHSKCRPFYSL